LRPINVAVQGPKLVEVYDKPIFSKQHDVYCIARTLIEENCITHALMEENLLVSSVHGTFRINEPLHDIYGKEKLEFLCFKQVKKLFENLIKKAYGDDDIYNFLDVPHLLDMLDIVTLHEVLVCYYAAVLTPEERTWLSIKLASIFKYDIIRFGRSCNTNSNSSRNKRR
jgi:hypothetical protein